MEEKQMEDDLVVGEDDLIVLAIDVPEWANRIKAHKGRVFIRVSLCGRTYLIRLYDEK